MDYDKMYHDCVENWKLVETGKKDFNGFCCEIEHFYNLEMHKNRTFFSVDGVIIAVAFEHCEDISIFGDNNF